MKCSNPDCDNDVTDPHCQLAVCESCWISSGGNPDYYNAELQVPPSSFRLAMRPLNPDEIMAIIYRKP